MSSADPIFMSLNLEGFKCSKCPSGCKNKRCSYFHSWHDLRRSWLTLSYSKYPCEAPSCKNQQCPFSHNIIEQKYHPDNYKKKYCQEFIETGACQFGEVCALAHGDSELKIRPLHLMQVDLDFLFFHFKSEFCPYGKIEHNRFTCVYAHNWQDFKRPFGNQSPVQCPHWNTSRTVVRYEQACPEGFACRFCHGWKERDYHPENFKTSLCENQNCDRKMVCSFLHPGFDEASRNSLEFFARCPDFLPVKKQIDYQQSDLLSFLESIECFPPKDLDSISTASLAPSSECKHLPPPFERPLPKRNSLFENRTPFALGAARRQSDNLGVLKRGPLNRKAEAFDCSMLLAQDD